MKVVGWVVSSYEIFRWPIDSYYCFSYLKIVAIYCRSIPTVIAKNLDCCGSSGDSGSLRCISATKYNCSTCTCWKARKIIGVYQRLVDILRKSNIEQGSIIELL